MPAPVYDVHDMLAEHLREMAAALLSASPGEYRPGAIAYLTGEPAIWGEPNLWRELPREVRDAMKGAATDLAFEMPGAETAAAESLVAAADMLASFEGIELDAADFSLASALARGGGVMTTLATYRNMATLVDEGMVAVDEEGNTYSANPGDYFWLADVPDEPLTDEAGRPLRLEVA